MKKTDKKRNKLKKEREKVKRGLKIALMFMASLLAFVLLLIGLDYFLHLNRVHSGVRVSSLNVSRTTAESGQLKLKEAYEQAFQRPVVVKFEDKEWSLKPAAFTVRVDYKATWQAAFKVGRQGDFWSNLKTRFQLWFKPKELEPVFSLDERKLKTWLKKRGEEFDIPPQDASLEVKETTIALVPGSLGRAVDQEAAFLAISLAFVDLTNRLVDLPVRVVAAEVTDEEARTAIPEVELFLKAPVKLRYDVYSWTVSPKKIARMITFTKEASFRPTLDREKVVAYIKDLTEDFRIEPRDAKFRVDGENVEVVPSRDGIEVDADRAYENLLKEVKKSPPRQVILTTRPVPPKLSTREAKAMGIVTRLSIFTTTYNPGQASRVNNIHLMAKSIDGALVAPGEIFSLNEQVGPRTAERGYQKAPVIVRGELVPGLGGGVCQVATTLFNTAFFAGLPIVERRNHSFYISHYPTGRDATISYGSIDLKFKNDTSAYLLIKAWYSSSSLTFAIYGPDIDFKVTYSTSPFSNYKPYKVEKIEDPTLPKGKEEVEQSGIMGRSVTVTRRVYRNGQLVIEDTFHSVYRPRTQVVRVGTKEEGSSETTPAASTTSSP
jgi:vancomycin resistance protein YoaR